MEEKEFSKSVIIKEIKVSAANKIIINGVEQPMEQSVPVICCPACGRVIVQFNPGTDELDVLQYISDHSEELQQAVSYCNSCGQKLSYPTIIDCKACSID